MVLDGVMPTPQTASSTYPVPFDDVKLGDLHRAKDGTQVVPHSPVLAKRYVEKMEKHIEITGQRPSQYHVDSEGLGHLTYTLRTAEQREENYYHYGAGHREQTEKVQNQVSPPYPLGSLYLQFPLATCR